jgi:hypothetical protein
MIPGLALHRRPLRLVRDRIPVGFANSGGLVFVDESAEQIASVESARRRRCAACGAVVGR